jgi:hypothetical protein
LKDTHIILHPAYFPNIETLGVLSQYNDRIVWEAWDNYQKQTYRNRCGIGTDQGLYQMNIPIRHLGGEQGRQTYRKVRMDESSGWRNLHWKTLQNAYRSSPYFEYYEDDVREVYFSEPGNDLLFKLNLKSIRFLCISMDIDFPEDLTSTYRQDYEAGDARKLVLAKGRRQYQVPEYHQVFGERHGFLSNLSGLDLLFNLGPESASYLRKLELTHLPS